MRLKSREISNFNEIVDVLERCKTLPMTAVYKIEINKLSGKRKLPEV